MRSCKSFKIAVKWVFFFTTERSFYRVCIFMQRAKCKNGSTQMDKKKGSRCFDTSICSMVDSSVVWIFRGWEIESFVSVVRQVCYTLVCRLLVSFEDRRIRLPSAVYFFFTLQCENRKKHSLGILFTWWQMLLVGVMFF